MGSADEQLLITMAKQGNDVAYEQLLASLIEPAHRLACGLLHDTHLAEDAVQEAAVRGWRKLKNLKDGAPIQPWFFGIVVNQCRDLQRGHWSRLVMKREVVEPTENADDSAIRRMEVRRLLELLSKQERLVIVLRFYVDLPWPDVAAIAGLTEAGARARFYRGLAKLRPKDQAAVTA